MKQTTLSIKLKSTMPSEDNKTQIKKVVADYLKSSAFTDRKLTDLPTDPNQVVPRRYVTLNGATAGRPTGSVLGQFYFDTTIGKPVWWSGSTWVDATGSAA